VQPRVLTEARKLLTAAMTFLSRTKKEVPLSAVKPMMQKLDPTFEVAKAGHLTFLPFVRAFPEVVRIEGEGSNRMLVLTCPPDEGGFTLPVQSAPAPRQIVIPPGNVLGAAHRYHWDTLRDRPVPDWNEYYSGLKAALEREGIEADENTLKGMRQILVNAKALRPKTDEMGIGLRPDFADEEAFQQLVDQFVAQQQIAAAIAALTAPDPEQPPEKP
ncbi:MAG TPA: OST-HTH/LOTUS domain-containing protein, partial [Verrucomicrobiales bacterium]|nr:OST-HTH/LOTUS domain-containing protein [Verrucomicrobiales bacterium]